MTKTAWYDPAPTNQPNHPGQGRACATCDAQPGAPCTNTTPMCGVGTVGAPLRGLHAARLGYAPVTTEATPFPAYASDPAPRTRTRRTRRAA